LVEDPQSALVYRMFYRYQKNPKMHRALLLESLIALAKEDVTFDSALFLLDGRFVNDVVISFVVRLRLFVIIVAFGSVFRRGFFLRL